MEYQNIINLLGTKSDNVLRFITKKWIKVHDQSGNAENRCKSSKQISFKTSMLRSDFCDFSDAYIVVKRNITVTGANNRNRKNRPLTFKNNTTFISCISKVNNTVVDNAEDLDVAMPMYNLIEYSKNYRKATGSLWNYCRDELTDGRNYNNFPNKNVISSESFEYKTSVSGSTYNVDEKITNAKGNKTDNPAYDANKSCKKKVEIAVPLKYLSNVWGILDMLLNNCEVSLILTWSREFCNY